MKLKMHSLSISYSSRATVAPTEPFLIPVVYPALCSMLWRHQLVNYQKVG